jgi:hypothetical protein
LTGHDCLRILLNDDHEIQFIDVFFVWMWSGLNVRIVGKPWDYKFFHSLQLINIFSLLFVRFLFRASKSFVVSLGLGWTYGHMQKNTLRSEYIFAQFCSCRSQGTPGKWLKYSPCRKKMVIFVQSVCEVLTPDDMSLSWTKSQYQISRFRDIRVLHQCIVSNGLSIS